MAPDEGLKPEDMEFARDPGLSLVARGLLPLLLTKEPEASIAIEAITPEVPEGRTAVANALRQLRDHGYLIHYRDHQSGRWIYRWRIELHPSRHADVA